VDVSHRIHLSFAGMRHAISTQRIALDAKILSIKIGMILLDWIRRHMSDRDPDG
jgi:hypothetical protein